MVSINSSPIILNDLHRSISIQAKEIDPNSLEGVFAAWINNFQTNVRFPANFIVTNYQDVAKLAFIIELHPEDYSLYEHQLADGLRRVAGRPITLLEGEPAPFCNDALALLGLALGASRIRGDLQSLVLAWMQTFANPFNSSLSEWKRMLLFTSLSILGAAPKEHELQSLNNIMDLRLALQFKGIDFLGDVNLDAVYQTIVHGSLTEDADSVVLAFRLAALTNLSKHLPAISLSSPKTEQVIAILENLPSAFKRWPWEEKAKTSTGTPQKWDLQNEYHVQSVVYFLLAPIFQDIENEFYFEPTGQLNSRADIGIPSLNLVIEIKFLRPGTSFAKIIEEVAADASLYFKRDSIFSKKYSKMLIFLWDDSARIQEHHEFKKGVSQLQNVIGGIVVSRPGNMPIATKK